MLTLEERININIKQKLKYYIPLYGVIKERYDRKNGKPTIFAGASRSRRIALYYGTYHGIVSFAPKAYLIYELLT